MDELYYEDGQVPDLASSGFTFSDEVIAKALVGIYKGEVDIDKGVEQNLYKETLRILNKATAKGISDAIDSGAPAPKKDFLYQLRHSNEVFSAFKTHTQQNHLADLLTDSKGKLKPFGQFAKDSEAVIGKYNRQWLRTEYDTAVIRAHQAANWQKFEEEKDVLPNLEWIPSTSPNPSEDHMVFWGTILPVDDGFWDAHRPGDRWNCKCDLRSTDKAATHAPDADIISKHDEPAKGLDNNPGKDGKIFNQSHPYFPKSCAACPFSSNGKPSPLADNIIGDCCKCGNVPSGNKYSKDAIQESWRKYNTYDLKYWERKCFNEETGGFNVYHKKHQFTETSGGAKAERIVGEILADLGKQVEFLAENGASSKKPDIRFDGQTWDIKSIIKANEDTIRQYIKDARKAQNVIFYSGDFVKTDQIKSAIEREIGRYKSMNRDISILPNIYMINKERELILIKNTKGE